MLVILNKPLASAALIYALFFEEKCISCRVSAFKVKDPRFNPGPTMVFIQTAGAAFINKYLLYLQRLLPVAHSGVLIPLFA